MKLKLYLFIAAFLMLHFPSISQSFVRKQGKPYFGQDGIKKTISELQAAKKTASKRLDSLSVKPLKSYFKRYQNFTKPEKDRYVLGSPYPGREDEDGSKNALRSSSTVSSATTQQVWSNFLSTDFYDNPVGWPPDPNGAVGANQVIVATNLGLKVYDKPTVVDLPVVSPTGYSRDMPHSSLFITLNQFFSPVLPDSSTTSDPHIRYDRLSKRWFVAAIEIDSSLENNLILLAVSDGDRITDSSSFTYYSFNSSLFPYDKKAPYAPFLDFPTLGVDKNSVVIGGNQFGYDSLTNVGYVIDKNKLVHGKLVVHPFELGVVSFITGAVSGMYTPQGVYNDDPESKKSFFAGITYNQDGIIIANIEYDKKNKPRLTQQNIVRVEPFNSPRDNSAPGGLIAIQTNDTRLLNAAIYKNKFTGTSSLWTAHAIGVNQAGRFINGSDSDFVREVRTGSRWYKIGNVYSKPRIFQSGTVYDAVQPSGRRAVQYFNPSVAASGQGHSIVSGTTDAYNEYLNGFAAGRYLGDELGTTKPPVKVTSTTAIYAPYQLHRDGTRDYIERWGDFSQTVVDPLDDQTIWTFQEYADVDDSYGVRAVQFKAPPPATPSIFAGIFFTDTTITLQGTSVNNSGFFDPGEDSGGPGYNRLSVKSTGNVIVSNIRFISPTEISFRLNIKNKPAGQYLLIITNPDGQFVVTQYFVEGTVTTLSAQRALQNTTAQTYITGSEVFPNPTTDNVTLQINAAKEYTAKIVLIDMNGKQLFEHNYSFVKGSNQAVLPTSKFKKGTYIAAVYNSDNVLIATQKIVKQ